MTFYCETIPAEGTDGKEMGQNLLIFTCHSFMSSGSMREINRKKRATDIFILLERAVVTFYLFSMCGDIFDSIKWCTNCSIGDSRSLREIAVWSHCSS